jgi:hypothetical protein
MSGCLDEVNSVRPPVGNLHGPPLDGLTGPGVALLRRGERIDPPIWRRQMQAGGYAATSVIARAIAPVTARKNDRYSGLRATLSITRRQRRAD